MALPNDRETRIRCFRNALRSEAERLSKYPCGNSLYVVFKKRPYEWLRSELSEYSLSAIVCLLHHYVESGGSVDEQVEVRPEYVHFEFHHDLRLSISGRRIYFETVLSCDDPDDPDSFTIEVVSVRDA